jgi:hypothetical protein
MSLTPYPTSLDTAVWVELEQVITGSKVPDAHSIHCLEEAQLFAVGQFMPDPPAPIPAGGSPAPMKAKKVSPCTKQQAADVCRHMIAAGGAASAHMSAVAALPSSWQQWLLFLLSILGPLLGA